MVVVALVVVLFTAVKFWRVVEESTSRPPWRVERPRTFRALEAYRLVEVELVVVEFSPVKFWRVVEPVTRRLARVVRPEMLIVPAVRVPMLPVVAKRLVELATFEKIHVEVAAVVVELIAVKFWRVVEDSTSRPPW